MSQHVKGLLPDGPSCVSREPLRDLGGLLHFLAERRYSSGVLSEILALCDLHSDGLESGGTSRTADDRITPCACSCESGERPSGTEERKAADVGPHLVPFTSSGEGEANI